MLRSGSVLAATLALALAAGAAAAQPFTAPPDAAASVASTDDAGGFLVNPAAGGLRHPNELRFAYADLEGSGSRTRVLGAFGRIGLAWERGPHESRGFLAGFGFGEDGLRLGMTTAWNRDAEGGLAGDARLGALSRPRPWASIGATVDHLFRARRRDGRPEREYVAGIGLRPLAFARERAFAMGPELTLTADAALREGARLDGVRLRFAGEVEVAPGVALQGGVDDEGAGHVGIALRATRSAYHGTVAYDDDGRRASVEHALSLHEGEERTAFASRRERRVAELEIGGELVDERLGGFSLYGGGGGTPSAPLHAALERALEDPLTRGVLLELRGVSGMAQIEELRPRIARLREAGKPVVAWLPYGGGRGDLYLAAACDRVVTSEDADFAALGLRAERRYLRRLLADWGVRVDRASVGRYKSAWREFTVDSTPPADREAIDRTLDVVQELFVGTVARERRMERARLLTLLDGRSWNAGDAQAAGLVDSLGDRATALATVGELSGLGGEPRTVHPLAAPPARRAWTVPTRLAVVYAGGAIEVGESGGDLVLGATLGSETLIGQLENAFARPDVAAVVLRIDSPGGSSLASALLDRAVERLKEEHDKPLVVSMAASAASGGYHLAAHGDRLFADRFTRTGSIGVVFLKPSFEGFLREHHVRQDAFERGRAMRGWSTGEDWDREMQAAADSAVRDTYRRFVGRVADGRGMSAERVDAVAQGRTWLGEDAKRHGLIDEIGGLEDAIAEARRRAGIPAGEEIRLAEYRRPRPRLIDRLVGAWVSAAWERSARVPDAGVWLLAEDEAEF